MKRILSLVLALLMLTGAVALFASCKNEVDGNVTLSRGTTDIDFSGYNVVYGASQGAEDFTATVRGAFDTFAAQLSAATGKNFSARQASRSPEQGKEILIGMTDRAESAKAQKDLDTDGFVIRVIGEKIVILGTDNLFTLLGLQYFAERYLSGAKVGTTLTLHESAIAQDVERVVLADSSKNAPGDAADVFTYVHQHGIASLAPAYAGTNSDNATSTYKEYPQVAIESILKKMKEVSNLGNKFFPVDTDKKDHAKEVLIGHTARTECTDALARLDENEYVVSVSGTRVVVSAWSETGLQCAVTAYMDLLAEASVKSDGKTVVSLPQGLFLTGVANENWVLDFPRPEGENISLYNAVNVNDGALQFLYTGTGVNATAYNNYCQKLREAGYTVYMKSEAEGSIFTTFTNKEEQVMLYAAYNAYTHKNDYNTPEYNWAMTKTKTGDTNVYKYDPCIRIISAPLKSANLPAAELLVPQTYEKKTDSKVTTVPLYSSAVGLTYIITLEDGSFIVFDGGNRNKDGIEHDNLWTVLCKLHEEVWGTGPSKKNPIRIAAWVLTHAHGDHYAVFQAMAKNYGSTELVRVDRMIANIPAVDSVYTLRSIAEAMTPERVKTLQSYFKGGFDYIKAHTGQKFYIANAEIEVLMTWEDHNPLAPNNTNETNTVLRFTLSNKDDPNTKIKQLWTGDANRWQSRFLCAMYGEYLDSDMISLAHHGNNGCEIELYAMASPTVVWWPNNAGSARSYLNPDKYKKDFRHQVDQYVCNELESVKYIYTSGVAGGANGSLDHVTTLVLKAGGPDYENIYDLLTGEKLTYTDITNGAYANVSDCMRK